jgi:hypothetical protein
MPEGGRAVFWPVRVHLAVEQGLVRSRLEAMAWEPVERSELVNAILSDSGRVVLVPNRVPEKAQSWQRP